MYKLSLLFFIPIFVFAQKSKPNLNELDTRIQTIITAWQVPGCAVAIVKNGKLIYAKGFGYRNVQNKLPVTPNTIFPIASNSKLFTATAIAMLVNQGLLNLNIPIKTQVPEIEFKTQALNNNVTLSDMLSHRTGISGQDGIWYGSNFNRQEVFERIKYLQPLTELRQTFIYSNTMYLALGQIIKSKTNKTWEEFLQTNILTPLQMNSTVFSVEEMEKKADYATAYKTDFINKATKPIAYYRQTQASAPANGINANITDLANWVICQLNQGTFNAKQIIPKSVIQETMVPLSISSGNIKYKELSQTLYAMGRTITTYKTHLLTEHGGAINGFRSQITMFPDDSLGIIILTNSADHKITNFLQLEIADIILNLSKTPWHERVYESTKKQFQNQNNNAPITDSLVSKQNPQSHQLNNYVGIYEHPAYGKIEIKLSNSKLLINYNQINGALTHIKYNEFETPFNEQLGGTYAVLFNLDFDGNINSVTVPIDNDEIKFNKK